MKKYILFLLLAFLPVLAETADVGTSGARFLRIGVGARPASFGESFSAVADDVNTIHWNPAGLGLLTESEVYISHNKWYTDITEQSLSYAQPAGGIGTLGGSIRYLHMGDIESWDENDTKIEDSSAYDLAFILAWGRKFSPKIFSGANIKIIQQKLDEETAMGFGLDLGFLSKLKLVGKRFQVALAVQNIGGQMKFIDEGDPMPMNIKFGTAYWPLRNNLIINVEANMPQDEDFYVCAGAEFTLGGLLALRAGYSMRDVPGDGIAMGLGLKSSSLLLDFAYTPAGELDHTYKVSLGLKSGFAGGGTASASARDKAAISEEIDVLYKKGIGYMKQKKYTDSIEVFTEIISLDPTHSSALKKLEEAHNALSK